MAEAPPITLRELNGMTPRQLEELAEERGLELPPRWTSPDVRQAIVGGGGIVTSESLAEGILADVGEVRDNVQAEIDRQEKLAAIDRSVPLSELGSDELRLIAHDAGVSVAGDAKKKDLITVLENAGLGHREAVQLAHQAPASDAVPESERLVSPAEAGGEEGVTVDELEESEEAAGDGLEDEGVTNKDLRKLAADHDVKVAKADNKAKLVAKLREAGVRRS